MKLDFENAFAKPIMIGLSTILGCVVLYAAGDFVLKCLIVIICIWGAGMISIGGYNLIVYLWKKYLLETYNGVVNRWM